MNAMKTSLLVCSLTALLGTVGCTDDPDLTESPAEDSATTDSGETGSEIDSTIEDSADTSVDDTGSAMDSTIDSSSDSSDDSGSDSGVDAADSAIADAAEAAVDSTVDAAMDSSPADSGADVDVGPPPSVASTLPLDRRVGVSIGTAVKVTFSAPMQTSSITVQAVSGACSGSFQLLEGPAFTSCIGGTIASIDGLTFTFTPAAALGKELRYQVKVTSAALGADGRALTPYAMTTGFRTQRFPVDAKVLYTSTSMPGNFGGAAGADTVCTTMASRPTGVTTAKAMLSDASRVACSVPSCGTGNVSKNWALHPNTHYVRADGNYVFLTDANGIYTAWSGGSDLGSGLNFWDGLNGDWTSRAPTCTDWTSTTGNGAVGYDVGLNSLWLTGGQLPCTTARPVVCAEQ
jgi:hypothetical protein